MGRRRNDPEPSSFASFTFLLVGFFACVLVYTIFSLFLDPNTNKGLDFGSVEMVEKSLEGGDGECCREIENLEPWGPAVKWGTDFKFNTSKECCQAFKAMCSGNYGPCLCDSWVFFGNREACKSNSAS